MNHAGHRLAFVLDADQRAVQRHPVDERLRAVDRIDDPAEGAVAGPVGQFFAHDRIVGKGLGNAIAKMLFRAAVGRRHRRIVALALHFQVFAAEILQGDLAGLAGDLQGQDQSGRHFMGIEIHAAVLAVLRALSERRRATPRAVRRRPIGYPQY